jgi:hypothetical protein
MHFFIGHESAVDVEFSPLIEGKSAESGNVESMPFGRRRRKFGDAAFGQRLP